MSVGLVTVLSMLTSNAVEHLRRVLSVNSGSWADTRWGARPPKPLEIGCLSGGATAYPSPPSYE